MPPGTIQARKRKQTKRKKEKHVNLEELEGQKVLQDVKVSKDRGGKPAPKDMTRKTRRKKTQRARKSISKGPSKQKTLAR